MDSLERRYRRLLLALPADHRAARGEELLGLLLDLDEGRTRPSPRQSLGVLGLALRLRVGRAGSLLVAAIFIAVPTELAREAWSVAVGGATIRSSIPHVSVYAVLLVPAVMWLGIAVLWLYGKRGAAFVVFCAYVALVVSVLGVGGIRVIDLPAFLLLGVATFARFPAPRARPFMLAMIPVSAALWLLGAALNLPGPLAVFEWLALLGLVVVSSAIAAHFTTPRDASGSPRRA
jgi:hypothetical protein